MKSKLVSIGEAVQLVKAGQTIGLGGMTLYRRPIGFIHRLITRQEPPTDLTILGLTAGIGADMLVGAGLVSHSRTCYFGLESFGLAPMFTEAVAAAKLTVIEESENSIASGLRARMSRIGFMPSRAWLGTDMFQLRPDVKQVVDPYSGEELTAFPAISCDVAVVHVLESDKHGNSILGGNPTIDRELVNVADTVIITAESIVDEVHRPVDIPGLIVSAVVHAPEGAWPTSCYPKYPLDGKEILRYISACNAGEFDSYIEKWSL